MKLAVIVTTYNRPDALAAVLEGYFDQDDRDFELIVADDGSTPDTRALADGYARRAPFPISHVWQEDEGFRAAAIRNRALARSAADYVVFTDGDCIPAPWFVSAHRALAERGWFVSANRVLLSQDFTRRVLAERLPLQRWDWGQWVGAWRRNDVNRLFPLLRLPLGPLRKLGASRWEGAKTCNLAAWRDDLRRVNGLDESYSGWGLEDSDLVVRLLRAGLRHKSARFAAPVLHLWHREHDRSKLPENQRRLDEILHSGRVEAPRGLNQYS
ncbi:MAG TPA: glycosyltransferase family 2 protein [Burkholderiales bacterium]